MAGIGGVKDTPTFSVIYSKGLRMEEINIFQRIIMIMKGAAFFAPIT